MSERNQQTFLRDDIHHLYSKIDVANFNVKKIRHSVSHTKQSQQNSQFKTQNERNKLTTQPVQSLTISLKVKNQNCLTEGKQRKMNFTANNFNKLMTKTQKNFSKTKNNTFSVSNNKPNRNLLKSKKISRIQTQMVDTNNQKTTLNKFYQMQKQHNKGRLKFKHIENWLNNILEEYCHEEYFDKTITNSALKKYYVDSNSLMSKGVQPKDVDRIYSSLFVYSIGFNNLLKQVTKNNQDLIKSIWKIYSLLLQYCAAGNYETLIGQIQRDKLRKIQELKVQIQKRQQIIQKNQQINQEKNMFTFKQLKRLKDQNFNLLNQRQILLQDFQQADQAFNEQVNLRLKFQNKINQIYGVHRQLFAKHGRLYHDFTDKIQDLQKISGKYFDQTKISQQFKYDLIEMKQKHSQLLKINNHDKQHIEVLLQEKLKLKQSYFQALKELETVKYINIQKERKLQQIQVELSNNLIIIQLRQKSAKQTHNQYQITLEQNNKLYQVINEQRLQIQDLLKEKKQFNQNVIKILADSSYNRKRSEQAQAKFQNLNIKILHLQQQIYKNQVQHQISRKQLLSCKSDLEQNYLNIQKMHAKNFQLQEQLDYLRKFTGNVEQLIGQKNQQISQLKTKKQSLQSSMITLSKDFADLQSRYKVAQIQLAAEIQSSIRKFQQLKRQRDSMQMKQNSNSNLLLATQLELDKYKVLFNNTLMDYKNQKFQRNNLNSNYQQSLKIMENKNIQAKQLNIMISQLKQQVVHYKSKLKITQLNLIQTTQNLSQKINRLKVQVACQKQIIQSRAHHVHPMSHEDLSHNLIKRVQKVKQLEVQIQKSKRNYAKIKIELEGQLKRQKIKFQQYEIKSKKQFNKEKNQMVAQIQYQKQRSNSMQKRLGELQMLQKTYKSKIFQKTTSEREEIYKKQLVQKSGKIDSLLIQIQKLHDSKAKQIKFIEEELKKKEQEKLNFVNEFRTKKQRELRQNISKVYQNQIEELRKVINQKINTYDESQLNLKIEEAIKSKNIDEILTLKNISEVEFTQKISQFYRKSESKSHQLFGQVFDQKQHKTIGKKKEYKPTQSGVKRNQLARRFKLTYDYYNTK